MGLFNFAQKKPASDEVLLSKYKEGKNTKYIGELYQRYTHLTFAVCMKYLKNEDDAKDAVMQLFERLMDDALKYDIDFFQGWFHTYIKNHCFALLKKSKKTHSYETTEIESIVSKKNMEITADETLSDKIILETQIDQLQIAISQLKEGQKECIKLFYLQEKSYSEITDITGLNFKQVKSSIQNGKRNLKIIMQQNG